MKIALALAATVLAFSAGAVAEERLEWKACRALSIFENGPPAWAKVHRPPERDRRRVELVRR